MPTIQKEQSIPYLAADMYRLVADIAAYPDFVPYCSATTIHTSTDTSVVASVSLHFYGVQQTFTTQNQMQPDRAIVMALVDGPIAHLQGQWQFMALGDQASKITLVVDYTIDNPWYSALFDSVAARVSGEILQAFVLRAKVLYGT
jgi:ribosome-associated toxin RatA of RatAB toxin-antitoxin module